MKEKPIIFSTPEVQAILDGRKTMTRRVIKLPGEPDSVGWGYPIKIDRNGTEYPGEKCYAVWGEDWHVKCKYAPGDLLWVRESAKIQYFSTPDNKNDDGTFRNYCIGICYDADSLPAEISVPDRFVNEGNFTNWILGLKHIPRGCFKEAARIWLEVTDVRVERLQEITEEDAAKEGALQTPPYPTAKHPIGGKVGLYRLGFKQLWDTLNAKRGYGWNVNPWVCVISFRRLGNELQK